MKSDTCYVGDCREVLKRMVAEGIKVQMCVTSPPYWGLRDYGTGTWEGGDGSECGHLAPPRGGIGPASSLQVRVKRKEGFNSGGQYPNTCAKCGARRVDSQIGLEGTMEEYVATMVEVFRLVREVLADDGTCWINLGDSYGSGTRATRDYSKTTKHGYWNNPAINHRIPAPAKQLLGIPWRVAFALQADGWYLRSDIIWHKPNPMPESCEDRPTKSHEYLFLLTKNPRYYYDAEAVMEPAEYGRRETKGQFRGVAYVGQCGAQSNTQGNGGSNSVTGKNPETGRSRRTVWTIPSEAFPGAHFATFPRKLVEPCILAGTSEKGHCPECGARWVRVVQKEYLSAPKYKDAGDQTTLTEGRNRNVTRMGDGVNVKTTGWRVSCNHELDPVSDVVLDPFFGSGTVGLVSQNLGRKWIGIDLNTSYEPMQERRTAQTAFALAAP